jgi:hypothetical protein
MKAIAALLVYVSLIVLLLTGWILNILKLVAILGGDVTAMFIARIVGVFFFPLGVILGWAV